MHEFSKEDLQFGSADPILPGITLKFPNLYGLSHDFQKVLFKYLAQDDAVYQVHLVRDFLENSDDDWEKFFLLSISSAAVHELRHFHEFYGSPFGAKILSGLLLNVLCQPRAMQLLSKEDTFAIPISSWARLSDELHKLYSAQTKSGKLGRHPPKEIELVTPKVEKTIKWMKWLYGPSENFANSGFSTQQLVEVSALSVQKRAIADVLGEKQAYFFQKMFGLFDKDKDYQRMEGIWKLAGSHASTSPVVQNALIFFALCGPWWDPSVTNAVVHPADRLLVACLTAERNGIVLSESNVLEFLNNCARQMREPDMMESLRQSAVGFERFVSDIRSTFSHVYRTLNLPKALAKYSSLLDQLVLSHSYMTKLIASDPMSFFDPSRYISRCDDWLAAPRWYKSNCYFFSPSNPLARIGNEFGEGDWFVPSLVNVDEDQNGYAFLLLSKFTTTGKQLLSPEFAYHFGIDNYLGNLIWAKGFSNQVDDKYALQLLRHVTPNTEIIYLAI